MAEENVDLRLRLREQAKFNADAKKSASSVRGIGGAVDEVDRKARRTRSSMLGLRGSFNTLSGGARLAIGGVAATVGLLGVSSALTTIYSEGRESIKVGKATTAVIKSTGGAANVTAGQVGNLANSLSNKSAIDDEQIQKGENLLLTFRNIRNEAGKGNDIFNQTAKSALDMSAGFTAAGKNMSVADAMLQLGKAVNDPVKGMTRLQRIGVTFTKQQTDQVAALTKSGDRLGAQRVIIREVNKEFGGMAASQADPMKRLGVILHNVAETIGVALIPYLDKGAKWLGTFITQMQEGTGAGGRFAAKAKEVWGVYKRWVVIAIGAVISAVKWLVGAWNTAKPTIVSTANAIKTGAVTAFNFIVKTAPAVYQAVKQWLIGAFNWVRSALGLTGGDIRQFATAFMNYLHIAWKVTSTTLKVIAGAFILTFQHVIWPIVKRVVPAIVQIVRGGLQVLGGIIKVFTGVFTGDWHKAWQGVKQIVSGAFHIIVGVVRGATAPLRETASRIGHGIAAAFNGVMSLPGRVAGALGSVVRWVAGMPGRIAKAAVGMFDGIWTAFKGAINLIIGAWNNLQFHIGGTDLGKLGHLPAVTINTPDIPELAMGGVVSGRGSWITGDQGPEVNTFDGSRVRVTPLSAASSPAPLDMGDLFGDGHWQPIVLQVGGRTLAEETGRAVRSRRNRG